MDKRKKFIITIDNEEDNQWNEGSEYTTENAESLYRFQDLCEKYHFKPVYLTTYGMADNKVFCEMAKDALKRNACEVGAHLHAWNNPPFYELSYVTNERPYLIEYPENVMADKLKALTAKLEDTFCRKMVSHRAGRWAMNDTYFRLLKENGYKVDCSVTPHINWINCKGQTGVPGTDYTKYPEHAYEIYDGILEVPMTTRKTRMSLHNGSIRNSIRTVIKGKQRWMRPMLGLSEDIFSLIRAERARNNIDHIEFMIHSSELAAGCNNTFVTKRDIDKLYVYIERIFKCVAAFCDGVTLKEYHMFKKVNDHK